ncbi:MAG: hypothetical protein ABH872_04835 [Candidatus Omnitrophota bacterium]
MKNIACSKCKEFYEDKLCSGFLPKVKLMEKYEILVSRELKRSSGA